MVFVFFNRVSYLYYSAVAYSMCRRSFYFCRSCANNFFKDQKAETKIIFSRRLQRYKDKIPRNRNRNRNIEKIKMDLERANLLYEIVQTTDDKELFFLSLNEICQILYSLITYEDCVDFKTPPSEQLKSLNLKRNNLINALEERIRISNINLDEYAKECNNYVRFKDKSDFDIMNGHDFEYFCADLLTKNGFSSVEVTQGSGDHGIDILAEKDGITYAIQCKCHSKDIGNPAVQQAHTGKSIYKKDIAVVLTNRDFTTQAKEEAEMLGVKLWNREKLLSLINTTNN